MSYYQQIYNRLRHHGLSEAGALGCLGNWECESNCEPGRVQGDFSSYRSISKAYVQSITEGRLTRDAFSRDQKGFGLAQWTYWSRKADLYDFWKQSGRALDDASLQVDFAVTELRRDYAGLYSYLCSTHDVYEACSRVCTQYERPAVNNISARFEAAARIRGQIDLSAQSTVGQVNQTAGESTATEDLPYKPELIPATDSWPPRTTDKHCYGYPEIGLAEAILICRGFLKIYHGFWSDDVENAVRAFQAAYKLEADGVVGPLTWAKLLERG